MQMQFNYVSLLKCILITFRYLNAFNYVSLLKCSLITFYY